MLENEFEYGEAQEYVIFNGDDPNLEAIRVDLPEPPDYRLIDGYGLALKDQKYKHPVMPKKLDKLQNRKIFEKKGERPITTMEINKELQDNQKFYREEIIWIKQQWRRRVYGYWFFVNGIPTYMTGWNYVFTGFWNVGNENRPDGMPDYRDRDRRFFLFAEFCYEDEDCYGFTYPKHRREGATFKAECINYIVITSGFRRFGAIQSMTEKHAMGAFREKLIEPWKSLPWFWKAVHNQSDDPKSRIEFKPAARKNNSGVSAKGLQGGIDYRNSSVSAYDGDKIHFGHHDEVGKKEAKAPVEVDVRWDVFKKTLAQGPVIHGMAILTSTVGQMEGGGGKQFFKICKNSHYEQRNKNNQTNSGLYNLFIPGYDGMDGFIDEYGNSVIEDPKEPVLNNRGKYITEGARTWINNTRDALKKAGDMMKLDEETRMTPISFRECFRPPQRDSGWNTMILHERIEDLKQRNPYTQNGNFEWTAGFNSEVKFVPAENGKFSVSKVLGPGESCRRFFGDDHEWHPVYGSFKVAGADPFRFRKAKHEDSKSKGAGGVFYMHNAKIDTPNRPKEEWESNKFICTYINDISDELIYCEDMLKMCVYYGAMMYSEQNIEMVNKYFEQKGFSGYLIYDIDKKTMKQEINAGVHVSLSDKQNLYAAFMNYIEHFGMYECHLDLLDQLADVSTLDDMTRLDLFAACGYALLGAQSFTRQIEMMTEDRMNVDWG